MLALSREVNSEKMVPYLPQRVLCRVWGYRVRASPSSEGTDGHTPRPLDAAIKPE